MKTKKKNRIFSCIEAIIAETIFHPAIVWLYAIKFITKKSIKSFLRRGFHTSNDISHISFYFAKFLWFIKAHIECTKFSKSLQLADTLHLFHLKSIEIYTFTRSIDIKTIIIITLYNMCLGHNKANSYTLIVNVFGIVRFCVYYAL